MIIRHLVIYISVILLVSSCASPSKLLQKGEYDKAIVKSAKSLQKKPTNKDNITVLDKAYTLANTKDIESIKQLKLSGQPNIFDEIVVHYDRLMNRQDIVGRLPQSVLDAIGYNYTDYSSELVESKKKAAAFFYAHGLKLLADGTKLDARQAYNEFVKVESYFPEYKDVNKLESEAIEKGTNNVILIFNNESRTALPEDFEYEMLKISLNNLNKDWLSFHTYAVEGEFYDYSIYLNLKNIVTSPEQVKEVHYEETKQIEDGFKYLLDSNGNVKKDSLGNDIKVPQIKTITCYVTETQLHKSAVVSGTIDFYNNTSNDIIKTQPITSEFIFDYKFATATGDLDALSKKTRSIIGSKPIPFPTDLQLIFDTNEDLKAKAKSIISANRRLLMY